MRFEIQLRTYAQDYWANLVEKVADREGLEIKYGVGDSDIQKQFIQISQRIAQFETLDQQYGIVPTIEGDYLSVDTFDDQLVVRSHRPIQVGKQLLVRNPHTSSPEEVKVRFCEERTYDNLVYFHSYLEVRPTIAALWELDRSTIDILWHEALDIADILEGPSR